MTRQRSASLVRLPKPFRDDPAKKTCAPWQKKREKIEMENSFMQNAHNAREYPSHNFCKYTHNVPGKIVWISLCSAALQCSFFSRSSFCCSQAWNRLRICWLSYGQRIINIILNTVKYKFISLHSYDHMTTPLNQKSNVIKEQFWVPKRTFSEQFLFS